MSRKKGKKYGKIALILSVHIYKCITCNEVFTDLKEAVNHAENSHKE